MKLFHTIHADRKQLDNASRKNAISREETHHSCHAMQLSVNAAEQVGYHRDSAALNKETPSQQHEICKEKHEQNPSFPPALGLEGRVSRRCALLRVEGDAENCTVDGKHRKLERSRQVVCVEKRSEARRGEAIRRIRLTHFLLISSILTSKTSAELAGIDPIFLLP